MAAVRGPIIRSVLRPRAIQDTTVKPSCMWLSLRTFCTSLREQVLSGEELKLDYFDGNRKGIAVVSINRPEARNSLSIGLMKVFEEVMDILGKDSTLRVAIIKSNVPGIFCAGADLKERAKMRESDVPHYVSRARALFHQLSEVPIPTIAALDGHALGGGLELALACDLRVAAYNAKIGLTETRLAIIPGAGGTQRLPRLLGLSKAKELMFTGRPVNGEEAGNIGLVDCSVEQNETMDAAYQRALKLADEILPNGPIALRMVKQAINRGSEHLDTEMDWQSFMSTNTAIGRDVLSGIPRDHLVDISSGLAIEKLCYAQVIPTKDRIEGLQAFKEKRQPQYKGE